MQHHSLEQLHIDWHILNELTNLLPLPEVAKTNATAIYALVVKQVLNVFNSIPSNLYSLSNERSFYL